MNISVVIPAFNEEKRLAHCLASLQAQKVKPFEIIVVNNNSTDKTAQIASKYGVTVVEEKVQGLTPARNRGFNLAKGDIIAKTDADTVVPPNWIELIEENFTKDPKLVGLSGPAVFGIKVSKPLIKTFWFDANRQLFGHDVMYGPNYALRKSAWEKIKDEVCMDDDEVHEDIDISIHLATQGKIEVDNNLIVRTSARRVKTPRSFMAHYPNKWKNTILRHRPYRLRPRHYLSYIERYIEKLP